VKIGVVADPLHWDRWPQAEAFLEPARKLGGFKNVIEPDEELFAVLDGDELLAVATAWFSVDGKYVEVKLVGGKDRHKWLRELDDKIGATARRAGARMLLAIGRAGWSKSLAALGWVKHGEFDRKTVVYSRDLKDKMGV
jgi:hypothetical protein